MKVQGKNGKFYEVDASGKCTCTSNLQRGVCTHSGLFIDLFKNKAHRNHYEIKAAFASELRRASSEAINWARVICKAKGNQYFLRFCRNLLRVETRNLSALEKSYATEDPAVVLRLLYESPQLHENPYYLFANKYQIDGYYRYNGIQYRRYQNTVSMLREFLTEAHDPEGAYLVLYFMEDNRELANSFERMLYDRAVDDRNWELIRYIELGEMTIPENWRFAVELMVRYWNPEAERVCRDYESPEFYLPAFKLWHVPLKRMKPVIEKYHDKIRPNKRLPKDIKCDLRYSNSWFGHFWRMLGMQQKGSLQDLEWDDVEFSVNDWLSAQILDKRYYPSLYQNILLAS